MNFRSLKKEDRFSAEFTLIEIVTVLAIVMIVSGIVLANLKLPVFASLDETTKRVRRIFTEASTQTALQGKEIVVAYNLEKKEFLLYPAEDENKSNFSLEALSDKSNRGNPLHIQRIPANIEVDFPDYDEDDVKYRFFPDGSASGPELTLTLKERKIIVGISRLTGLAYSRDEE